MSENTSVEVAAQTPEQRTAELEARVAALTGQLEAIAAKKTRKGGTGRGRNAVWGGLSLSGLLRSLGYHGWTAEQLYELTLKQGWTCKLGTCQNAASQGRMWLRQNPCALKGDCGPEPTKLTEEQLAELVRVRDGGPSQAGIDMVAGMAACNAA